MNGHDRTGWLGGDARPRVIELAGAPGAGKTTLLPLVVGAVESEGLEPLEPVHAGRMLAARTRPGRLVVRWLGGRNRSRMLWALYLTYATVLGVLLAVVRPGLLAVLARQARRPREAMVSERHIVRWFIRHAGTERLFLRLGTAREVLVVDEGYVHRVVQLFTSSVERADRGAIRRYLAQVPPPTLLVVVEAPPDIAWERIRSRGVWSRMSDVGDSDLARFVRHASEAVSVAKECALEEGWRVLIVDNSLDGEAMSFGLPRWPNPEGGADG